ncbi:MAG: thioredoxin family protein [Comamonadaceae bacterium]|nr:thioredoxin family protein [Comamonadaceae bacterium]
MNENAAPWSVWCLCADWCRVCGEYRSAFEALAAAQPQLRCVWIDVEDEEALLGELDVETFPTLLIAEGQRAHFLGPLPPQVGVLERLLANYQQGGAGSALAPAPVQALLQRLQAAHG